MNREITITRTESVNYITVDGEIKPTGQKVQNTYSQDWDDFCNTWGNIDNWKELDKNGKLQRTMFLGGACYKKRNDANTVFRSMFILDIDNKEGEELISIEKVKEFLNDYDFFIYSTYSSTPEYPRFRVMLPLVDDVQAEEWKQRQEDMKAYFAPIANDSSCFTLSQGQIMPCYPIGKRSNAFSERVHGVFFDINTIPKVIRRNLVIDEHKTYTTHAYSDDVILDYVDVVSAAMAGTLDRPKAFTFACWCVANGIHDYQYVERTLRYDEHKTTYERAMSHMMNASQRYMNYCGNNYHMGFYNKHLPSDFWIKHAPKNDESFKFDNTFNRFEFAKKEAQDNGWEYYELIENEKYGKVHKDVEYGKINMLISDCGTGKSWTFKHDPMSIVLSPYTLLAEQTTKTDPVTKQLYPSNNIFYGSATYDQAETLLNDVMKGGEKNKAALNYDYSKMTLVVDECHVLYNSGDFRPEAIRSVFAIMKLFKRVIFMSGTARPEYFSSVKFDKVIRVCKHYPFKKNLSVFFNSNHLGLAYSKIQESAKPGIILVNSKQDIIDIMKYFSSIKFTVITSETKQSEVITDLIKRSTVGNCNYIIGTISVVEGLNFTDKFEDVNVYIIDTDNTKFTTEQIEQVTNRWREAANINTYVFRKEIVIDDTFVDFSESSLTADDYIRISKENADIANRKLSRAMDKTAFKNTYKNTCFSEMIRFDTTFNQYVADYQLIDYARYDIRRSNEQLDYQMYLFELERYGFEFNDTTYAYSLDIREEVKNSREAKKLSLANAKETIVEKYDPTTGKFDSKSIYTPEEEKLKGKIRIILAMGNRDMVNNIVMKELPKQDNPEKFLNDITFDIRNHNFGNLITDEIERIYTQISNGRDFITNNEKEILAESVLKTIKLQRYDDELHMAGGNYAKFVNNDGSLTSTRAADAFLQMFISYDRYRTTTVRGIKAVKFSRTGLL
ncbi:DEAD/DEAH box helicase family protein [Klebsiella michiganensis]|uniref:DEAD/DEAH box helicase family protein n=1 Tax=Klebsiella michiganensis TaxID=1134687 RepID=UPI0018C7B083|nr:DEAD/DEAH box helicase family protein [Klebsiella michiganensis]MBG2586423.1 DEAD/DEAH box helicase family protein [Klebsiella michiganensis]